MVVNAIIATEEALKKPIDLIDLFRYFYTVLGKEIKRIDLYFMTGVVYRNDVIYADINAERFTMHEQEGFRKYTDWIKTNYPGYKLDEFSRVRVDTVGTVDF